MSWQCFDISQTMFKQSYYIRFDKLLNMFNPTKSNVKWYKRNKGTYAKQIPLKVDCEFIDGEIVYILSRNQYEKYCNPDLYDENLRLKDELQNLKDDFDSFRMECDSTKEKHEQEDAKIIDELMQNLEDEKAKSEKLRQDMDKMIQEHKNELKDVNNKLYSVQLEMNDVQRFNAMLVQDANRKNLELKDYQNEVDASIRKAVNETEKNALSSLNEISNWDFLFHKDKINLNIAVDEIIESNIPTRKQGFFEVITIPNLKGDDDEKDSGKNDE